MGPLPMLGGGHRFIFLQLGGDGESSDCDEADTRIIGSLDHGLVIRMQTDAGPRLSHCSQTGYFVLTILNVERNPSSSVEVFSALLPVTAEVPGSNLFNRPAWRDHAYIVSRPRTRNPRINQNLSMSSTQSSYHPCYDTHRLLS